LTSKFGLSIGAADAGAVFTETTSMPAALNAPATRRKRPNIRQTPSAVDARYASLRRW
jgi:hypothetical protein